MGNATEVSAVDKFSLVLTLVLAFFFLQDVLTFKTIIGCLLITIGSLVMILE
ncbi:Bacterial/Archaeal Transporter family protein [Streptococcus oralis]|uniref:Bacterial/Archaeal Transporter family protein n=2 Tax=Streptococcus TaxID=1301 RepID=A0A139QSF1_STROR|nr:Bacterial/Archaeal Transporter family protein [Streptococcus oralis]